LRKNKDKDKDKEKKTVASDEDHPGGSLFTFGKSGKTKKLLHIFVKQLTHKSG